MIVAPRPYDWSSFATQLKENLMGAGTTLLRVVVGGIFVGHGLQKLRGYWGGPGLEGTEKMMESMEMHPAPLQARAVALAETAGGAALALGFATPYAAAALIATMVTAVRKVHFKNGLWNSKGGYEYNAVLATAVLAVVADGPGVLSADAIAGKHRAGLGGFLFAIIGGVAGSFIASAVGSAMKPTAPAEPSDAR
jgi:putative oxidoreductase